MTGYILCALLVTAGLFILTGTRPGDVTSELKKPFEKEVNRKRRIRQMTGKKPSPAQRMMEEAVTMLDASGMGEQVSTYRNMAALLAMAGFLFGLAMAISNQLQTLNLGIPYQAALMVPYLMSMIALLGFGNKKLRGPAALGKPYMRNK